MRRVNHQDGYSVAGACTNGAESYFPLAPRRTRTSSSPPGHISLATFRRRLGGRTSAVSATASRRMALSGWPCDAGPPSISRDRQRTGRLDQPPFNDARGLGALIVFFARASEPQMVLWISWSAVIGGGDGLHLHDPFSEFSRRHRPRRVTQHVVDQTKAFAGTKPAAARPRLPESDLFGTNVRIKQQHRRVEVRETGAMLRQLLLQPIDNSGQLRSLVA